MSGRDPTFDATHGNAPELNWKRLSIISFVLGIVALTIGRGCTRHVPDPPPSLGPAPVAALVPPGAPPLAGVRIYAFVTSGPTGAATAGVLTTLASFATEKTMPVTLVALRLPGATAPTPAPIVSVDALPPSVAPLVAELAKFTHGVPAAEPWRYGLVLVDSAGELRGAYPEVDNLPDGVHGDTLEVMYRAAHVLRQEREAAR